jgi:hypothetical protein
MGGVVKGLNGRSGEGVKWEEWDPRGNGRQGDSRALAIY